MLAFDYLAFAKYRGSFMSFIYAMLAFGSAFLLLTSTALTNPIQYPAMNVISTSGNILIPSYNVTMQMAQPTLSFVLPVEQLIIWVQFVLIFVAIGGFFLYRRKKRYGLT